MYVRDTYTIYFTNIQCIRNTKATTGLLCYASIEVSKVIHADYSRYIEFEIYFELNFLCFCHLSNDEVFLIIIFIYLI